MTLRVQPLALLLAFALARGAPLHAQRSASLHVVLPATPAVQGPVVEARDMLEGSRMREPLAAGFPARLHFRVELWTEGKLFNDRVGGVEYDVLVRFIALEKVYEVLLMERGRKPFSLGKFASVDDAERAVGRPTPVAITAPRSKGRLYYQVSLEVAILDFSDLDEVGRWLRGVGGERNPGTALTRGVRGIAARLLGGQSREYEATTATFRVP